MNFRVLFRKAAFRLRERCHYLGGAVWRRLYWVAQGAKIAPGVAVPPLSMTWPHQVEIARGCLLEPDLYFKFDGIYLPGPTISVGEGVFLGRGCEFNIRKGIRIGARAAIASGCKFVDHDHDVTVGGRMDAVPGPEAEIEIGEDVWLGANVVVLKGVTIGKSAVVGAGAIVTRSVPENEIWVGIPARRVGMRPSSPERKVSMEKLNA